MRRYLVLLAVGMLAVTTGCAAATPTAAPAAGSTAVASAVRQLDPVDFAAQVPNRVTINVHVPDEGSLPDTDLALPYDQISTRQSELPADRNTEIAIYCLTGHMSAIAGQTLSELGYTDIVELRGGMAAWRAAGLPFVPAS
jgi:rhodanese-related sulfurtransferase